MKKTTKVEVMYEVAEGIVEHGYPEARILDKYIKSLEANGCKVLAVVGYRHCLEIR